MRMQTVLIGICALVFGIAAAAGVYLLGTSTPAAQNIETVSVYVANVEIVRGQMLSPDLLTKRDWPKSIVPEGAVTNLETVLERTVAIPMIKGDLLLEGKLATKGAGRGMAAIIPNGMRAVTIQTPNVATGVAGFIMPGNKVDVLLTMNGQVATDPSGGGTTITLLQNIEILAVDQLTDVPQGNKVDTKDLRSVTLLVTPVEAARIDLGQNKGTLRLTLRNPIDKVTKFVDPLTLADLTSDPSQSGPSPIIKPAPVVTPVAPPVMKRTSNTVRTLRGTRNGLSQVPGPIEHEGVSAMEPPPPLSTMTH